MNRLVVFPLVIVAVLLIAGCDRKSKPESFRSENGGFSVMIPEKPMESSQTLDTPTGKIEYHTFTAQQGRLGYMIGYSDYAQEWVRQTEPQTILDGSRDGAVGNINGKLVLEKNISLAGNPGRELVIDAKDKTGRDDTLRIRIFLVGNRLYQVIIAAPKGEVSTSEMDDFLESFKLTAKR